MDEQLENLQKIVDFINGVDENSAAYGMLLAMFCFMAMIFAILFGIALIKKNPEIFNNYPITATNNKKTPTQLGDN